MTKMNLDNELLETSQTTEVDSCGCAIVPEIIGAPAKADCPLSGTHSHRVLRETLDSLIIPDKRELISKNVQYYFCSDLNCPVVYFSNDKLPLFEKSDLNVKVYSKDNSEDVNVCYCFDWTRKRLSDQIKTTGSSTAFYEITEEVKAGNCVCESKNPKGVCCLGDIQKYVKEIS